MSDPKSLFKWTRYFYSDLKQCIQFPDSPEKYRILVICHRDPTEEELATKTFCERFPRTKFDFKIIRNPIGDAIDLTVDIKDKIYSNIVFSICESNLCNQCNSADRIKEKFKDHSFLRKGIKDRIFHVRNVFSIGAIRSDLAQQGIKHHYNCGFCRLKDDSLRWPALSNRRWTLFVKNVRKK